MATTNVEIADVRQKEFWFIDIKGYFFVEIFTAVVQVTNTGQKIGSILATHYFYDLFVLLWIEAEIDQWADFLILFVVFLEFPALDVNKLTAWNL